MAPPPPLEANAASLPDTITQPLAVVNERLPWRHTFISLKVRNFRIFAIGHFVAVIALWMQRIAQDWLVLQLSGSVTAVGITVALQFLPSLFLGPWAGMMADRFAEAEDPHAVPVAWPPYWPRPLPSWRSASGSRCGTSTRSRWCWASSPCWTSRPGRCSSTNSWAPRYLRNAISVNSTIFQLGGLIGPAIAGILLTAVGAGWAFAANAVACCSTVAMLLILRKDQLHVSAPAPKRKGMLREGLRYALSKPTIYWPWLMAGFIAVFAMSLPVLLAAFADHVYDVGAGGYGLLNALVALGALAGAIASARRRAAAAALGGPGRRDVRAHAVPGRPGAVHGVVRRGHGAVRILVPDVPDRLQPAGPDQLQPGDPRAGHEPVHHGADRRPGHRRPDDRLDCRARWTRTPPSWFPAGVPVLAAATVAVVLARRGAADAQSGPEGPAPPAADRPADARQPGEGQPLRGSRSGCLSRGT